LKRTGWRNASGANSLGVCDARPAARARRCARAFTKVFCRQGRIAGACKPAERFHSGGRHRLAKKEATSPGLSGAARRHRRRATGGADFHLGGRGPPPCGRKKQPAPVLHGAAPAVIAAPQTAERFSTSSSGARLPEERSDEPRPFQRCRPASFARRRNPAERFPAAEPAPLRRKSGREPRLPQRGRPRRPSSGAATGVTIPLVRRGAPAKERSLPSPFPLPRCRAGVHRQAAGNRRIDSPRGAARLRRKSDEPRAVSRCRPASNLRCRNRSGPIPLRRSGPPACE